MTELKPLLPQTFTKGTEFSQLFDWEKDIQSALKDQSTVFLAAATRRAEKQAVLASNPLPQPLPPAASWPRHPVRTPNLRRLI
ncbi:hypothetical protein [Pseudotabrizicola sp. L79]|uniref:hypothetical protein n=1 Tax=Pseudotabrizicola sp. L79 TaxID=3118402 RepID=UPI002F941E6E